MKLVSAGIGAAALTLGALAVPGQASAATGSHYVSTVTVDKRAVVYGPKARTNWVKVTVRVSDPDKLVDSVTVDAKGPDYDTEFAIANRTASSGSVDTYVGYLKFDDYSTFGRWRVEVTAEDYEDDTPTSESVKAGPEISYRAQATLSGKATVLDGRQVRVKGVLRGYYMTEWTRYVASRPVTVYSQVKGKKSWKKVKTVKTGSSELGPYKTTAKKQTKKSRYKVVFKGDAKMAPTSVVTKYVKPRR